MSERVYDLEEANAALADLRERLPRLRDARRRLITSSRRIEEALALDGGGVAGSDVFEASRELKTDLTVLAERGILLRDPESGLVDFPADLNGTSVYLCWQLGEEQIGWYHERNVGYRSRKRL